MPLNPTRARQLVKEFNFRALFIDELGWDRHQTPLEVTLDGQTKTLQAVAQKRGMVAYHYPTPAGERVPEYAIRRKIEHHVAKAAHEHLIVFTDAAQTTQIWQWVKREPGKPAACREHTFHKSQPGDALVQKLQAIAFTLDEEERLTLPDVTRRARAGFDVERVTKRFYDQFQKEHAAFLKFIDGITESTDREWYASVMLNRLMFVYFIQRKGFLDGDREYLRNRLNRCQQEKGKDQFYSFYRYFLLRLFHEGFGKRPRDRAPDLEKLLGRIPYLNGGFFEQHQVEQRYSEIQIPDRAFERIFNYFDQYQWHLDERPLRADNEINPDVLGFIFEKYINQKQMGAYYTKEDITEYISKNTVIPFLFDAARPKCKVAFEGRAGVSPASFGGVPAAGFKVQHAGGTPAQPAGEDACLTIWDLLAANPDRYIYPAVRHGTELPLPPDIAAGEKDVSKRGNWNKPAPGEYALPTEIWREVVTRRKRCDEIRKKLAAGAVRDINELITLNLDIRQFAQDVIENCEGPELLRAFWHAIAGGSDSQGVTILDPTCGSGAFLFAALNVLEPLYEACLDRMEAFVEDLDRASSPSPPSAGGEGRGEVGGRSSPKKFSDFRKVLERVAAHPNRRYFIFKSIILSNLFGVDIMEEAVEICKLRLFLKLAAQVEPDAAKDNLGIEPLPDIDFNIRAGNTLVGYATAEEVRRCMTQFGGGQMRLGVDDELQSFARFSDKLQIADAAFRAFRQQQTELGGAVTAKDKAKLEKKLEALENELNGYLAAEYGVKAGDKAAFAKWLKSHQPFHWFIEFYGIVSNGGFDVIIGNPPYVELSSVTAQYRPRNFATQTCGNLYALCTERSFTLQHRHSRFGFIVQQPVTSTIRMAPCREIIHQNSECVWSSTFDDRPSKLFDGMHHARLAIVLCQRSGSKSSNSPLVVTPYNKWYAEEREHLFDRLSYVVTSANSVPGVFPKISTATELGIARKLFGYAERFEKWLSRTETPHKLFYKITGVGSWFTITPRPPKFFRGGEESSSTRENTMSFESEAMRDRALCVLNSSLFYWFYQVRTNCRDFNPSDYKTFPVVPAVAEHDLSKLARRLKKQLVESAELVTASHSLTGEIRYERFRPRVAKPVIDEIDRVLAKHYGFTDEELDFILNYDIKYRLGLDSEHEDS